MAAQLALSRADVVTPTGDHTAVRLRVRLGTAALWLGSEQVATMGGVTKVESTGRRTWLVHGDGGVWSVTKVGGCGCGGR